MKKRGENNKKKIKERGKWEKKKRKLAEMWLIIQFLDLFASKENPGIEYNPVPETFKAFTPKLTLKKSVLNLTYSEWIWLIGHSFTVTGLICFGTKFNTNF